MGFGGEHELSTLILPLLDVIISEAKRVVVSFETNYQEKVASVILSGGGSNLIGLEDYFSKHFGLPTRKANPFSQINYPPVLQAIAKTSGPLLAVAIGLGIKGFR